jgi:hypothetical protein
VFPFAHAFVSALAGAQQLVATKNVAELTLLTFNGNNQVSHHPRPPGARAMEGMRQEEKRKCRCTRRRWDTPRFGCSWR